MQNLQSFSHLPQSGKPPSADSQRMAIDSLDFMPVTRKRPELVSQAWSSPLERKSQQSYLAQKYNAIPGLHWQSSASVPSVPSAPPGLGPPGLGPPGLGNPGLASPFGDPTAAGGSNIQQMHSNVFPGSAGFDATLTDEFTAEAESASVVSSLKEQIDVLITAIMMSSQPSTAISKGIDAVAVSHRVMTRIEKLREENNRLADLASGMRTAELEAQNTRLTCENAELKAQLAQYRTVGFGIHQ